MTAFDSAVGIAARCLGTLPIVTALVIGFTIPPGNAELFTVTLLALGPLSLLLLWAHKDAIRNWTGRRVMRTSLGLIAGSLVAIALYSWTYDHCVVAFEGENIVFPLWPTGDLAFMLEKAGSPTEALYTYQPAAVKDAITQQPSHRRTATRVVMLMLYQGIFVPLSIAFGIAGIKGIKTLRKAGHKILFLAANPAGLDPLALAQEARAIHAELERGTRRERFRLETRWAVQRVDLLHELRSVKPTIVHFSGHGSGATRSAATPGPAPNRDAIANETREGLYVQAEDGSAHLVSTAALERIFAAAGASTRLVVLNACHSESQAAALLAHVDCVVVMSGSISDDAARTFAAGFYGALGDGESVQSAYQQACASLVLGEQDGGMARLEVRDGFDASRLVLGS